MNFGRTYPKCTMLDIPWCLMGDFNKIASLNEKLGGPAPNVNRFQRLNFFLSNINAKALQVMGNLFTWKKRVHMRLVYERFDRIIVRNEWVDVYPNPHEIHGSFTRSNRCPMIVST